MSKHSLKRVVSTKKNGGHSNSFTFIETDVPGEICPVPPPSSHPFEPRQVLRNVQSGIRSTFLPSGFPNSTPDGYLTFSVWSWIQDLTTHLRGVIATQRVLEGVGVGREGATALSALLNFLVRDGCGMLATLLFTSVAASRFRADVKRWRLFADIMIDVGITLEVAATHVPHEWFLPMISVGNMCKAICGVAAGACGGAINLHWAGKGTDISDIQAKFGAQHTVTASLGLIFAALFARTASSLEDHYLWSIYALLTSLHIFANRQCVRLIAFNTFNIARMNMVLHEFFHEWDKLSPDHSTRTRTTKDSHIDKVNGIMLSSPKQIARTEPLLFLPWLRAGFSPYPIEFGVSFNHFVQHSGRDETILRNLPLSHTNPYWILTGIRDRKPHVLVVLHKGISQYDQAKAYFHAVLLSRKLAEILGKKSTTNIAQVVKAEEAASSELEKAWEKFEFHCQIAGWNLNKSELQTHGYEIEVYQ